MIKTRLTFLTAIFLMAGCGGEKTNNQRSLEKERPIVSTRQPGPFYKEYNRPDPVELEDYVGISNHG